MRRRLLLGLATVLWIATAPEALAHGGSFGKHGPRGGGPGGGGPGTGRPQGGPVTETGTGYGGPIVSPGGPITVPGSRRKKPIKETFATSWELWWQVNRPAFLWQPHGGPGQAVVTPQSDTPTRFTAKQRADAIALLLRLVDPATKAPPDVRASACLALAKIAPPRTSIEPLMLWVRDESAPELVRESAALAFGLIRRSEADKRMPVGDVDRLRAALLMLWDQHVDGKRVRIPDRTRQFAMIAIGMLGDQPFADRSKPGLLLSTVMWERVKFPFKKSGFREALLLALGHQPLSGAPDDVREGMRGIAAGERIFGINWKARTRGHATAAVAVQQGTSAAPLLLRHLADRRAATTVRLATLIALDRQGVERSAAVTGMALRVLSQRGLHGEQPLLVHGLGLVTTGGLLGDELRAGRATSLREALPPLNRALTSKLWSLRGFGAVALGRAFRGAVPGDAVDRARQDVVPRLRAMLQTDPQESTRGAAAIALGLMGAPGILDDLRAIVANTKARGGLRGHAAIALALHPQAGKAEREVVAAAVRERDISGSARAEFARAAARLGGVDAVPDLLSQLAQTSSERHAAAVASALGYLGNPDALAALSKLAEGDSEELVRAMAVVAIGRMLDEEPVPSLARFTRGVVYPIWTDALRELLTIL